MAEAIDATPAAVRLLRDFVNSAEPQTGRETFDGPVALSTWCRDHGLLPAGTALSPEDVEAVIAVREGLRAVLQAHAGHEAPTGEVSSLHEVLRRFPVLPSFDEAGRLRLHAAGDGAVATVIAVLLDAVRQAATDGTWERLKACAKDSCRWAFYDSSRNRSGRWCSMAGCGNQVKMRRAHARRRGATT